MGIPWFVIGPIGPTGGYLVGFILAPYVIGFIMEKIKRPGFLSITLSMISGVLIIYLFGLIQFSLFTQRGIIESFPLAVIPFIPFDIGKGMSLTPLVEFTALLGSHLRDGIEAKGRDTEAFTYGITLSRGFEF